jgi:hypothetical protein
LKTSGNQSTQLLFSERCLMERERYFQLVEQ